MFAGTSRYFKIFPVNMGKDIQAVQREVLRNVERTVVNLCKREMRSAVDIVVVALFHTSTITHRAHQFMFSQARM